jgi:hypothetical protein
LGTEANRIRLTFGGVPIRDEWIWRHFELDAVDERHNSIPILTFESKNDLSGLDHNLKIPRLHRDTSDPKFSRKRQGST